LALVVGVLGIVFVVLALQALGTWRNTHQAQRFNA